MVLLQRMLGGDVFGRSGVGRLGRVVFVCVDVCNLNATVMHVCMHGIAACCLGVQNWNTHGNTGILSSGQGSGIWNIGILRFQPPSGVAEYSMSIFHERGSVEYGIGVTVE